MNDIKKYYMLIENLLDSGKLKLIDIGITKVVVSYDIPDSIIERIREFAEKGISDIKYGMVRGNCGVVAAYFLTFYGEGCKRENGYIFCPEYNKYSKKDLTDEELEDMKVRGYDINSSVDVKGYVVGSGLENTLKHIPHYWNIIDGTYLVDFSVYTQCIKRGYIKEISKNNYCNDIE